MSHDYISMLFTSCFSKIYWNDNVQGHIVQANYDGTSANVIAQPVFITDTSPITFDEKGRML